MWRRWLILLTFPACSAHALDWTAWSTNGVWQGLRDVRVTSMVYCTTHQATFTNWIATNASVTQTVAWIANVYGSNTGAPNPIVSSWQFSVRVPGTAGLVRATETRVFTNSLIATNLTLYNSDIMLIETWHALQERAAVIGVDGPASPRLPRYVRENTVALKNWITNHCEAFVQRAAFTNGTFTNWWANSGGWYRPPMVESHRQLAALNALPTNYFEWTPAREPTGVGVGAGRVVTTQWRIATSAAGIVTQTTVNACGDTVQVSGTNGQQVSAVCTNAEIEPGRTSLDYGLNRIQTPINFLSWTTSITTYGSSEYRRVQGPSDTEVGPGTSPFVWADAVTQAGRSWTNQADDGTWQYDDGNDLLPRRNTSGQIVSFGTNFFQSASIINAWMTGRHSVLETNISHEADLFMGVSSGLPNEDTPYAAILCFDLNVFGYALTTNLTAIATTNTVAEDLHWPIIGDTSNSIPAWTDAPVATNCNTAGRGFAVDRAAWLIRWDVTGGYRFKGE